MKNLYSEIEADARARLSERRFHHSVCVADTCRKLAVKYGGDEEKAALAGIGHDVFKELTTAQTFEFASLTGIVFTDIERAAPKLWHAITGSVYLEKKYGLDADIISAVRYHTTGRQGMTLLEKIVYTADFISPDRDYPGVDVMREKACDSLEKAMAEGLRFTVEELSVKGVPIHPDTFNAYNEILMENTVK